MDSSHPFAQKILARYDSSVRSVVCMPFGSHLQGTHVRLSDLDVAFIFHMTPNEGAADIDARDFSEDIISMLQVIFGRARGGPGNEQPQQDSKWGIMACLPHVGGDLLLRESCWRGETGTRAGAYFYMWSPKGPPLHVPSTEKIVMGRSRFRRAPKTTWYIFRYSTTSHQASVPLMKLIFENALIIDASIRVTKAVDTTEYNNTTKVGVESPIHPILIGEGNATSSVQPSRTTSANEKVLVRSFLGGRNIGILLYVLIHKNHT